MAAPVPSAQPPPVDVFTAAAEMVADQIGGSVVGGYAALLTTSATAGMTLDETARSVLDGTISVQPNLSSRRTDRSLTEREGAGRS